LPAGLPREEKRRVREREKERRKGENRGKREEADVATLTQLPPRIKPE
jgi:hypothetical protein